LGRNFDTLRQDINLTDEIPKLSFVKQTDFAPFLESDLASAFRLRAWPGLGVAQRTDWSVEVPVPGGAGLHLVIKDESFVNAAKTTYFLMLSACRLFARRHVEPSRS
jgi:hypothetical protein